ncbi:MAG: hypothetical protein ABI693_32055 [Bryobacteraceae bacterium]
MVHIGSYVQGHNRIRLAVLVVSFLIASFALYLGVAVYALTTGPKAVGDYIQARFAAAGWMALAMLANVGAASILANRGSFLRRFLLSIVVTIGGSILVFGLIVIRVVFFKGLF